MDNLRRHGLIEPVKIFVASGRPFLGICLGMQLLFDESEEFGPVRGLGICGQGGAIRPRSRRQTQGAANGWNGLHIKKRAPHLAGLREGAQVYFVHSYYPVPADPEVVATTTDYGGEFASSVWHDNVYACQFHPRRARPSACRSRQLRGARR